MSTIRLSVENSVAQLTIDRAEKHNALTQSMWQQIAEYCDQLENEINPKVLVITGAGVKAFSAGADIEELTQIIQDDQRLSANNIIVQSAQSKIQNLPFATIASINGVCVGGGMGIAMACDFRISVEQANFAITPSKLGLLYSIEDTRRLVNLVGLSRAKELLFLGKKISAQTALDWGLVNQLVAPDRLFSEVEQLSASICEVSATSISGMKQTLAHLTQPGYLDEPHIRTLFDQAFKQMDFHEGATAFIHKRAPKFK